MGSKDDGRPATPGVIGRMVDKLRPHRASAPAHGPEDVTSDRPSAGQASGAEGPEPRESVVAALDDLRAQRPGGRNGRTEALRGEEAGGDERRRRPALRLQNYQSAIEAQIAEARQRGDFDNLPGKGKPLDLRVQQGEADGTWAAHHVLQGAGMQLPWVALGKEIDADLDYLRKIRERLPLATRIRRRELLADYEERARAARQKTARYNLMVPNMQLQRLGVDAEGMIREVRDEVAALDPP